MPLFTTDKPASLVPYSTPKYGWRFLVYLYLLSQRSATQPMMFRPAESTLSSLRQKITGGRHYLVHGTHDFDFMRETIRATKVTPLEGSVFLSKKASFDHFWGRDGCRTFWFFAALTKIDEFIKSPSLSYTAAFQIMPPDAQSAMSVFCKIRQLKSFTVGETFITIAKTT